MLLSEIIHNLISFRENETRESLSEIQIDPLIPVRRPDLMMKNREFAE